MPEKKKYQKGTSETLTNLGRNVASYFLNVKNTGTVPSEYRPTRSTDPESKYYTWPHLKNDVKKDITGKKYLQKINDQQKNFANQNSDYLPSYVTEGNFDQLYNYYENSPKSSTVSGNSINLGLYQVSPGKDQRGRYIGIYDKYDWNLLEQMGYSGRSWETYDRIYEDEWDQLDNSKRKMPSGGKINNMPDPKGKKQPKTVMNPTDVEQVRAQRILELSRQWGVPTNQIFTQADYGPTDYQGKSNIKSRSYYTFDPQGKISKSIRDISPVVGDTYYTPEDIQLQQQRPGYGLRAIDSTAAVPPSVALTRPMRNGGKMYENGGGLSRESDYGSKKKPYPSVSSGDFAGGGRSYPIPTKADAVDALRLAALHGRSDIKSAVYKKYPSLKKAEYGLKLMEGYHRMPDGSMMENSQMADTGANILNYAHMMNYGGHVGGGVPMLDEIQCLEMTPANQIAKSGIHIKKENRGKFTASANRAGMGVQEYARHVLSDPNASGALKKRANFARNAAKWHKGEYGLEIPSNLGVRELDGIKRLEMARYGYAQNGYGDPWNMDQEQFGDPVTSANPPGMTPIDLSQATDQLGYAPNEGPQWNSQSLDEPGSTVQAGNKMPNIHINAGAAIAGLAGLVTKAKKRSDATNEFARLKRRGLTMPTYNQNPYGTGSQAISKWGTTIGGKSYNFSADQVKFLRSQGYKI